jgi:hypothetical protein
MSARSSFQVDGAEVGGDNRQRRPLGPGFATRREAEEFLAELRSAGFTDLVIIEVVEPDYPEFEGP